jgi:TonB-linked SusC/RagA family outer membrane protein
LAARYAATIVDGGGANDQTGTEKSTTDSRVKNAVIYHPIPLKNLVTQDDNVDASSASLYSPLQTTADNNRYQNTKDLNVNGGVSINITKDLVFHSSVGYTSTGKIDDRFFGLSSYYVLNGGALQFPQPPVAGVTPKAAPTAYMYNYSTSVLQNSNTLNYIKKNLFPDQDLSVLLGEESYNKSNDYIFNDIEAFPVNYTSTVAWNNVQNGDNRYSVHFFNPDERMLSFFGRVNYDIKGRYLLAATFRADGSSKFSQTNRWGYFPSVSAGWRISDESFMKGSEDWLSNLKLRASLGQSGNNRIDNSAFLRTYSTSSNTYLPNSLNIPFFSTGSTLANADLKWETTTTRGVGLDYGFFKNRLSGSIDLYSNTTSNVLMQMATPGTGYATQWQNVGQTSNKGIEFNLSAVVAHSKDFNLNIGFNISQNINNVDNLGTLASYPFNESWTSYSSASNSYVVTPGQPIGIINGYVNDGMYASDDFVWSGSKWSMNTAKYSTQTQIGTDGTGKPIYKYSDKNGNVFVNNSALDGLSWGPGAMKLKDLNGDGQITDADRKTIGNTNPKFYGALNLNGNYKGFDFSTNLNFVYGNNIYNANKIELTSMYYKDRNMLSASQNSYTQIDWATGNHITDPIALALMNANATMWAAPTGQYTTSSWAIEDGSFLRLSNLTVGYTLPSSLTKKFYVQKLRFYATGNNLFILTNYSGYDPEVDSRRSTPATPGVDYSAYPKSRSYIIGVNITF